MPYTRRDPERHQRRIQRLRQIPVRRLVPNVITLLALCAGLTGIRLAFEGRYELALAAIVFAAMLDAVDGRIARLIKGTSRFGAELDSLADFVNFGVAPGLILYFWELNGLGNLGWIAAMVFAICAGLRLARFNVQIEDPNRPQWAGNFFTGMPAPAGAITVLLPMYVGFLGLSIPATITLIYTLVIAALMVSRLPVLSGKQIGNRVPPELVLPVIVVAVLFVALLVSYPWHVLSVGTVIYLACLPLGWWSYQRYQQADAALAAAPAAADDRPARPHQSDEKHERPARLN
jgi:CDP-diacylglycerol--serine O-phosphatidyltransferase